MLSKLRHLEREEDGGGGSNEGRTNHYLLGSSGRLIVLLGVLAWGDIGGLVDGSINSLSVVVLDLVGRGGLDLGGVDELATDELVGVNSLLNELGTEGLWEIHLGGDAWVVGWLVALLWAWGNLEVGWDLWIGTLEGLGQWIELLKDLSITLAGTLSRELDNSVIGLLLGELVHQSTREDTSHLVRVEGINLLPQSWANLVAAKLREEDWESVVGVGLDKGVVSGSLEGVLSAPLVRVDTEEVDVSLITALHVVGEGDTELNVIGVGVTDWDVAWKVLLHVGSHVTVDGLDVDWRLLLRALLVNDLVSGKESKGVVVAGELLHDGEDVLEVHWGVGGPWLSWVHVLMGEWGVDVKDQVDAGSSEHSHALVVVEGSVDGVDTDSVDTETLEKGDITGANIWVGQRVPLGLADLGGSTGLVINTLDKEWLILGGVEMSVLDLDGVDGADGGSEGNEASGEGNLVEMHFSYR